MEQLDLSTNKNKNVNKNKMKTIQEAKNHVNEFISELRQKTDYEIRKISIGIAFTCAEICKKHFEPGGNEYNELYSYLWDKIDPICKKAKENVKTYEIEAKISSGQYIWEYSCSEQERTAEEAKSRVMEKQMYNPYTGRKVSKPKFLNIEIAEKQ
jgi:hypothetical protein